METTPIFIFSPPRSGSTLLQRILAFHPDIATISEPWILLPILYTLKDSGWYSEFNQDLFRKAIRDVQKSLPNGRKDYFDAIKSYTDKIYQKLCYDNERYFLDKTPRYYLIIKEIADLYPDAKFIFLFRHPLSIFASIINTYNNGRLCSYWNKIDLYEAPERLSKGYDVLRKRSIAIRYEDLIDSPETQLKNLCDYLNISYSQDMINVFNSVVLKGKLGDPTGIKVYQNLDHAPLNKWKNVFDTRFRKKYASDYIRYLGPQLLNRLGYSMESILKEIEQIKPKKEFSLDDRMSILISKWNSILEIPILKKQIKKRLASNSSKHIHVHY